MNTRTLLKFVAAIGIAAAAVPTLDAAPFGSAFTYQGRLNFSGAPAADGLYDFRFTLHDVATLGAPVGAAVDVNAVPVTNGLFTAQLDFGAPAFTTGEARWLQLEVNTNGVTPLATLKPRQRLAPTPQAIYAGNAGTASAVAPGAVTTLGLAPDAVDGEVIYDGSISAADLAPSLLNGTFWKLGGNAVFPPGQNFLGTMDFRPLEFRANNLPALRLVPDAISPNLLGGHPANHVGLGVSGAFIGGGGKPDSSNVVLNSFTTVVGGYRNTAAGEGSFVGGGRTNGTSGEAAFVGGGSLNAAGAPYATVVGGLRNLNFAPYGTVSGGSDNTLASFADHATISGGAGSSIVDADWGTIGGGGANRIRGVSDSALIGGGYQNSILTNGAGGTIAGGDYNQLTTPHATIGGGTQNIARGGRATISGGLGNTVTGESAFIGGGWNNTNSGDYSVLSGGTLNLVMSDNSTIGGGRSNLIDSAFWVGSTIGGGLQNHAEAPYASIGGGRKNRVTLSTDVVVGGGVNNIISARSGASTIAGGSTNIIDDSSAAVIAGGSNNVIQIFSSAASVGGGDNNGIGSHSDASTISGGYFNRVTAASYAAIGGGSFNTNFGDYATVQAELTIWRREIIPWPPDAAPRPITPARSSGRMTPTRTSPPPPITSSPCARTTA